MADGLLEAVRGLRLADPELGPKPLLVELREQRPDLDAGEKEVREALLVLKSESEATEAAAAAPPAAAAGRSTPLNHRMAAFSLAQPQLAVFRAATQGDHNEVAAWLRDGGGVDALLSHRTLLMQAALNGQEAIVRMLLQRGASVNSLSGGFTALMCAAGKGHTTIVQALLNAKADALLQNEDGCTAHRWALLQNLASETLADFQNRSASVQLLHQHVLAEFQTRCADVEAKAELTRATQRQREQREQQAVVDSAERERQECAHAEQQAQVDAQRAVTAESLEMRRLAIQAETDAILAAAHAVAEARAAEVAAEQQQQYAIGREKQRQALTARKSEEEEASQQKQTLESRRVEEEKAQRMAQLKANSVAKKKSRLENKEKKKAPSLLVQQAEAALQGVMAGGGLSALEAALAAAPRNVREGDVGVEAQAQCNRLRQEAECEAKHAEAKAAELKARQEAAAEAARLAATVEQQRKVAAQQEAVRMAIESEARAAAPAAAAAAAAAEAAEAAEAAARDRWRLLSTRMAAAANTFMEQTAAAGSEVGSSRAAGPSEASEAVEVPDEFWCPITAEIMTDPVSTQDGFTYEREAITEWLRTKDTSPRTNATLESKTLVPNLSLRSMINSFFEAATAAAAAAAAATPAAILPSPGGSGARAVPLRGRRGVGRGGRGGRGSVLGAAP